VAQKSRRTTFALQVGKFQFLAVKILENKIVNGDRAIRSGFGVGGSHSCGGLRKLAVQDENDNYENGDGDADC
jgi:hypothetical protein